LPEQLCACSIGHRTVDKTMLTSVTVRAPCLSIVSPILDADAEASVPEGRDR
jgi:hypothetical protein